MAITVQTANGQVGDDRYLRVNFVDVGQGDAIWIKGPTSSDGTPGANVIIDGGPDSGSKNRLVKFLNDKDYGLSPKRPVDCVIVSHPHDDHYPGLIDILQQYEVRSIIDSGYPKELTTESGGPSKWARFRTLAMSEKADGKKSQFVELRTSPLSRPHCGDLDIQILYSDSASSKGFGSENTRQNNASTVVRLTFGGFSFLFMGDAEGKDRKGDPEKPKYVEELLLRQLADQPKILKATVLKVAHHGSTTSSTLPFIKAVNPDVLVIMSGRKAFAGTYLPDEEVIDRYKKANPKLLVVRTDQNDVKEKRDTTNDADGDDIYMYTDGDTLKVAQAVGLGYPRQWKALKTITAP